MAKPKNKKLSHSSENDSSRDSHRGLSKKQRVLATIQKSEIELRPWEIAQKAMVNRSTTRDYLRDLLKEGKVVQPYPGAYCSKIIHGMIVVPVRVHCVILGSSAPWLDFSDDVTEFTGDVKVRVQFGIQRRRITGRVSCDAGMDKNALLFAIDRFFDIVKERTGRDLEEVVVKTFECNRDFFGVRLDGVKCYTKKGLHGVIERIYQKEENVVRYETKFTREMTLDQFRGTILGGIREYDHLQTSFVIMQEVRKLTQAVKFNNEVLGDLLRLERARWERENQRRGGG